MLFFNQEFVRILQDYYLWTDEQLKAMIDQYTKTMIRIIIDESLVYIEDKNLSDLDELKKLQDDNLKSNKNIATQTKLMEFALNLHKKYPELEKHLIEKIKAVDQDLTSGLLKDIDEATAVKILKVIEKDLNALDQYTEKLKTWGIVSKQT